MYFYIEYYFWSTFKCVRSFDVILWHAGSAVVNINNLTGPQILFCWSVTTGDIIIRRLFTNPLDTELAVVGIFFELKELVFYLWWRFDGASFLNLNSQYLGSVYIFCNMSTKPLYVGQLCFNLDQEGSKWKRLRRLSLYMPVAGYYIDLRPLPTSTVSLCKR